MYSGRGVTSGVVAGTSFNSGLPQLPQVWVDNNELTCKLPGNSCATGSPGNSLAAPAYDLTLGASGGTWSSGAPSGCTFTLANYTNTMSGLQNAVNDAEACRTSKGTGNPTGFIIHYPAGLYSDAAGIVIPQTSSAQAAAPIILRDDTASRAALDALPALACAGGIQDNVPTSTKIGLHNPDCTGKNMYYQLAPANGGGNWATGTPGVITGITTLSASTYSLNAITASGSPQLLYLANGYVAPGNSYTVGTGGNQETVAGVVGVNQVGLYGVFTKAHAAGTPVTFCASGCSYTPANGQTINTSNYNYVQYMAQIQCTTTACVPLQFCSPLNASGSSKCAGAIGPDHWQVEDAAISLCPGSNPDGSPTNCQGASNNQFMVITGNTLEETDPNLSHFAQHIHLRRLWIHGDMTSLGVGENAVADGLHWFGCLYCSFGDSQISQGLRPGAEGHSVLIGSQNLKMYNLFTEGSSSNIFCGGFGSEPGVPSFVPCKNVEYRIGVQTFPYPWLGFQCAYSSTKGTGIGNACGDVPDYNPYWGGAGDTYLAGPNSGNPLSSDSNWLSGSAATSATRVNVSSGSTTVNYVSGPPFHDANSSWNVGSKTVHLYNTDGYTEVKCNSGQACKMGAMGGGTCALGDFFAPPGGCPTTMMLTTAPDSTVTGAYFVYNSPGIVRKNIDELKEAQYLLKSGLILEGNDNAGAQFGIISASGVRGTSGGALTGTYGANYNATIEHITVEDTIGRHTCTGRGMGARSGGPGDGGGVSFQLNYEAILNSLDYDVSMQNPGCGTQDYGLHFASGNQEWNGTLSCTAGSPGSCTFVATASVDAGIDLTGDVSGSGSTWTYSTAVSDNKTNAAICGCGTAGQTCASQSITPNNVLVLGFTAQPGNNSANANGMACVSSTATTLVLTNSSGVADTAAAESNAFSLRANPVVNSGPTPPNAAAAGYFVLGERTGDLAYIKNQNPTANNCPAAMPHQFWNGGSHDVANTPGALITQGTLVWDDAWTAGKFLTITYQWNGATVSDNTGNCIFDNLLGGPDHVSVDHYTLISDTNSPVGNGQTLAHGANWSRGHLFRNSILLSQSGAANSGWYNAAIGPTTAEGTATETFENDFNTLTADFLVFPGRPVADYTEYGNNPNYPDPNGCTGTGCKSLTALPSIYFPATPYCTGSTATSACVGFMGAMNLPSGPMPLNLPDYHSYSLRSDSAFHNGASDGSDLGANLSAIDAAQTLNTYVCHAPCGTPGPFPNK
jgi:hypothetical protein